MGNIRKKNLGDYMINILTLAITIFSIIMISYKRVNLEILKKLKSLIYNINKQYIDFFEGKKSEFKIWQLIIFIISQVFVVFAIVRRLFEEVYKYVSDNYIVAVKISTYLIIFIILYFSSNSSIFIVNMFVYCKYIFIFAVQPLK